MQHLFERAYNDWASDLYDEWYQFLWDKTKGPLAPILAIMHNFPDLREKIDRNKQYEIRILDAACGTGNMYIALSLAGFDVWGADGSRKMLERALHNCKQAQQGGQKISEQQLIVEPLAWTNSDAYYRHFVNMGLLFDLILVCTNSFCHLPSTSNDATSNKSTPRYMQEALINFRNLLKPSGRLLVDTKRYELADPVEGVPMLKELKYDKGRWVHRQDRMEESVIKGKDVGFILDCITTLIPALRYVGRLS